MIERIPDLIQTQTGEYNGTTFDIIPKETFAMVCRKVNEVIDYINHQNHEYESIYDAVNDRMIGCTTLDIPKSYKTRPENVRPDAEGRPVNVQDELYRTKKQLEIANDTLRHTEWFFDGDYNVCAKDMRKEIKLAIKAISNIADYGQPVKELDNEKQRKHTKNFTSCLEK